VEKTILVYLRFKEGDNVVINRHGLAIEAHHSMNSPGETNLVKRNPGYEVGKNVPREQRLRDKGSCTSKWIELAFFNLWIETLHSQRFDITASTIFLFRIRA